MSTETYTPPVSQLLSYGGEDVAVEDKWPDYLALGFGPEHIPELIRLATDKSLQNEEVDEPMFFAPLHAMRTLGQLKAEAAIEPLLPFLDAPAVDKWIYEWAAEDLTRIYSLIGPAAIPALRTFLGEPSNHQYARSYAADALAEIAQNYPEARSEAIAALMQPLALYEQNDAELNAFLIGDLTQLKAVEALPTIEQAFEADKVDEFIIDRDFVQVGMGLKEREEPRFNPSELLGDPFARRGTKIDPNSIRIVPPPSSPFSGTTSSRGTAPRKEKNKRKMAKLARKKNKRKK